MADIIEDELYSSSVIKDLQTLDFDYVPEELPHRMGQLRQLAQLFKPLLSSVAQNAMIKGPVGTGKTAIAKHFCQSLVRIARKKGTVIEYVHINCRKRSTDGMVLLGVLSHFDKRFPDRGFSVQEMLQILKKQLERREAQLILVLDEVDALLKKSGSDLLYTLTRFSDESMDAENPISLIIISQKDVLKDMDLSTVSTFKRSNLITLDSYARDELVDIVRQRVGLAFHPHTVFDDSVELIADIASEWGDARFAIELLWMAGVACDQQHQQLVVPEHVRAAKAETYSTVTETKLKNLGQHQLLALYAVAKRLQKEGTAYVKTGDVEQTYNVTCEEFNVKSRAHTMFWSYLKDIESAGFIDLKLSGKGHLGTSHLISLPDIPAEILAEKVQGLLR